MGHPACVFYTPLPELKFSFLIVVSRFEALTGVNFDCRRARKVLLRTRAFWEDFWVVCGDVGLEGYG